MVIESNLENIKYWAGCIEDLKSADLDCVNANFEYIVEVHGEELKMPDECGDGVSCLIDLLKKAIDGLRAEIHNLTDQMINDLIDRA